MAAIKIKTELKATSKRVFVDLTQIKEKGRRVVRQFWFYTGHDMRDEARKEILRKPKGGRTYVLRRKRGGRGVRHVASAPFETHANFTGKTRGSIGFKLHGKSRMSFGYGVSRNKPATEQAAHLEFGTIGFKKVGPMAARPSLASAIDKMEGRAQRNLDQAVKNEFVFA